MGAKTFAIFLKLVFLMLYTFDAVSGIKPKYVSVAQDMLDDIVAYGVLLLNQLLQEAWKSVTKLGNTRLIHKTLNICKAMCK